MDNENKNYLDIITTYKNYLYTLREKEEYKDKYGDTKELVEIYEKKLQKYLNNKK